MIHRAITADILKDLGYFPAIGIVGPRQAGKTTLSQMLMQHIGKPALYLDLESDADLYRLRDPEAFLLAQAEQCVVIDEVQRMPSLFPLLRSVIDRHRVPARFILLGSASPELLRQSSESLAGRISFHELSPLSLSELSGAAPLRQHWFRGGYPPSLLAPDDDLAARWLDGYFRSFIERDLRLLFHQDIAPENMRRFLLMLSHLHGQVLNISGLAASMGISTITANKYLDILEGAFWVRRLPPWYANLGKRLVKSPKLYFRDSGLIHRLWGLNTADGLLAHPALGASWEGYAMEQVRQVLGPRWEVFYYRTQVGAESDLLLVSPTGRRYCVEIKASNTPVISKGFFQSVADLKPDAQYILVPEAAPFVRSDGIEVCGLEAFLKKVAALT
jgi:uncharacterized protein